MSKEKRDIHGVLLLNKPKGVSSNNILQRVKHLFKARKAGHTGALDPLATGMLPICFGEATKFSQYLLDADKTYTVTAKLGLRTDTSDAEGEIVAEKTVGDYSLNDIETALNSFRGEISQTPSIYSALKYQGKPLYYYARQGIDVPRPTRQITIFNLSLVDYQKPFLKLKVHCSKGTYIRTIVDDLGELLGCGAHVSELHRDTVGNFPAENMVTVDALEKDEQREAYLLPLESLISDFKQIQLTAEYVQRIRFGQKLNLKTCINDYVVDANPLVALMDHDNKLIGIGEVDQYAILSAKRLLSFQAE